MSASSDKTIKIWNEHQALIHTLIGHQDHVVCLEVLDDEEIASGSLDNSIKIWKKQNNSLIWQCTTLNGHLKVKITKYI